MNYQNRYINYTSKVVLENIQQKIIRKNIALSGNIFYDGHHLHSTNGLVPCRKFPYYLMIDEIVQTSVIVMR